MTGAHKFVVWASLLIGLAALGGWGFTTSEMRALRRRAEELEQSQLATHEKMAAFEAQTAKAAAEAAKTQLLKRVKDLEWSDHNRTDAELMEMFKWADLEAKVGVIQVNRYGYSITFTNVEFKPEGLRLEGTVGSYRFVMLSTVTLEFMVKNQDWQKRRQEFEQKLAETYEQNKDWFDFISDEAIGTAEAPPIAVLAPGSTAPFSVVIPNVVQKNEGIRLMVCMKNERYTYNGN